MVRIKSRQISNEDLNMSKTVKIVIAVAAGSNLARNLAAISLNLVSDETNPLFCALLAESADFDVIIDEKTLSLIQESAGDDPLFRSVDAVAVSQDGSTIDVATTLSVAGSNRPVPVSVQLRQI
jgi:hypothetical protein